MQETLSVASKVEIHSYIQAYLISLCFEDTFFCFLNFFIFNFVTLCYILVTPPIFQPFFHYYYICHCDQ